MRFIPFGPELDGVPHVVIGGRPRPDSALALSHLPGVTSPPEFEADTTAEIVLRLLRSVHRTVHLDGIAAVTSERCDADSLLGVWSLLHPEEAADRAERVADAARAGAFSVRWSAEAAQFACWVRGFRRDEGLEDDGDAFGVMLPLVAGVLDNPRTADLYWIGEYSDLIHDGAMLNSGAVQIEEYPDLDLSVMETPLWLHDLVRFSALSCFRLLTVRSENTFVLEYRRESGVRYHSRRPLPRLDLRPLGARLNLFERNAGQWRAEPVDSAAPRLFFDNGEGRPSPSALDAETVIDEVRDFFRVNANRHDLQWSPYSDGPAAS
ncbi:MAG: DUF6687 family protein [Dehalococcoidia bacterium]